MGVFLFVYHESDEDLNQWQRHLHNCGSKLLLILRGFIRSNI